MKPKEFKEKYQALKYKGDKRNQGRYAEVLELFLQGNSDKEIAKKVHIQSSTVRGYLTSIYETFAVADRKELLDLCYQHIPDKVNLKAFSVNNTPFPLANNHDNYLERPPIEEQCQARLTQPCAIIRIKGLRQIGKTYLIEKRLFPYAQHQGYATVLLDFNRINASTLTQNQTFSKWFCKNITRQLKLEDKLSDFWDDDLGTNDNCTIYFEDYILLEIETPLVLALDNLHFLLPYGEVANDFTRLLRYWLESHGDLWQKLRLISSYSTETYQSLDLDSSPFDNLEGLVVTLPEFSLEQVSAMVNSYQLTLNRGQIEELTRLLGGHPYLLKKAFTYLQDNPSTTIAEFKEIAPTPAGIYQSELLQLLQEIRSNPDLLTAMKQIVNSQTPVKIDPILVFKLDTMGLIQRHKNEVSPRNLLYRLYFQENL